MSDKILPMNKRFRSFLPVIVDVETGGFDCKKHALLEVAAVFVAYNDEGLLAPTTHYHAHVEAFQGSLLDEKSLEVTGIRPHNPFDLPNLKKPC